MKKTYKYPYFKFAQSNSDDKRSGIYTDTDNWFYHFKKKGIPCAIICLNDYHSIWRVGEEVFGDTNSQEIKTGTNARLEGNAERIPDGAVILKECYNFSSFLTEGEYND